MNGHNYLDAFYDEETGCYGFLPNRRRGGLDAAGGWLPPGITPPTTADLGFHFTGAELAAIKKASAASAEYMAGYGKGRAPRDIDTSHYYGAVVTPLPIPETNNECNYGSSEIYPHNGA